VMPKGVRVPRRDRARWLPGDQISGDSAAQVCAPRQIRGINMSVHVLTAETRFGCVKPGTVESPKTGPGPSAASEGYLEDCAHPVAWSPGDERARMSQVQPSAVRVTYALQSSGHCGPADQPGRAILIDLHTAQDHISPGSSTSRWLPCTATADRALSTHRDQRPGVVPPSGTGAKYPASGLLQGMC
jgi:hypothetical protein